MSSAAGGINHVTVVGAGLMGSGIAQVNCWEQNTSQVQSPMRMKPFQVAAQSGHNVTLVELDSKLIDKAKKSIEKNLERVAKKQYKDDATKITAFVQDALNRISGSTNILETAKNTDIVIEAIVERLEVKQKLFSSIDAVSISIAEHAGHKAAIFFRSRNHRRFLPATLHQFQSERSQKARVVSIDSAAYTSSIQSL